MNKEFEATDYVYPVCLPDTASHKYENITVNASGWGSLDGNFQV